MIFPRKFVRFNEIKRFSGSVHLLGWHFYHSSFSENKLEVLKNLLNTIDINQNEQIKNSTPKAFVASQRKLPSFSKLS
jgi:hypothetical protein